MLKQKIDRYEIHKYWGKKPANDLRCLIDVYSSQNDLVLDPFSGYGVFGVEAYLSGRNVISNDLNPISNFINKVLIDRSLNIDKLLSEWSEIRKEFEVFNNHWFSFLDKNNNHTLVSVLRDKSGKPIKAKYRELKGKAYQEVNFTKEYIDRYLKFEEEQPINDWFPVDDLLENSRISAKGGMKVYDLFTKRTLACHAKLYSLIEKYSSGSELDLLKLAFTANLANCSKLVPPIKSRGDLSQGAWMTGFYIGNYYIENNVLEYFENRLNKAIKGKLDFFNAINLNSDINKNTYKITNFDAKSLQIESDSIDYIFVDPPYGEAIPYFEQSIIWNSWLRNKVDYQNEIVVSNSRSRNKNIEHFEDDITKTFTELSRVLKKDKFLSLTYHSISGNEWKSITNACIKSGFDIYDYKWLTQKTFTPRQLNRNMTIKGDILITFINKKEMNPLAKPYQKEDSDNIVRLYINELLSIECLSINDVFIKVMKFIFDKKMILTDLNLISILNKYFKFNQKECTWGI